MRKVDWELVVAARTLGARLPKVVSDVYWPQVRFSFVMTGLIVFVISSSFFVAPALLGGPGETMLGIQMKSDLVNRYDSGMAATTGTALTIILLIVAWIALKLSGGSFRRVAEEVAR
jgi:ABC-type spermidine/putrescine transport system permease subunit I